MSLTDFLLARIAEDEEIAENAVGDFSVINHAEPVADISAHIDRWYPARVLAECEAKRQIVGLGDDGTLGETPSGPISWVLKELAQVYADHHDYDPTWRP